MGKIQHPDLSLLQAFDTVARRKSFTLAAEELCLTQSAVSRKIQTLEVQIGVKLFKRLHRSIELTDQGHRLHEVTQQSIEKITTCLAELHRPTSTQITVSASVAFAYFWLMPRLGKWRSTYPDIDLRVISGDRPAPPKRGDIDVAILFGRGTAAGLRSHLLFGERVYPVCSRNYLKGRSSLAAPRDLLDCTLIHLDYGHTGWGSVNWKHWLSKHGIDERPRQRGINLNSYPMVLQAAESGQGVALGWSYITDPMVAKGLLAAPMGEALVTDDGYHVCIVDDGQPSQAVQSFVTWVRAEAAALA